MENDTPSTKSLVKKLCEVMAEVDRIPKAGWNDNQKYKFVTESDVMDAVRKHLAEKHILIVPVMTHCERTKIETDKQAITSVTIDYVFIDGDTDERLVVTMAGQGADYGDKGVYKAMTGATKYCILKTFLMSSGDDPEADESTDFAAGKAASSAVAQEKLSAHKAGKPINAPQSSANGPSSDSDESVGTAHITINPDGVTIHPVLDPALTDATMVKLTVDLWRKKMDAFNVTFDVPTRLWLTDARTLEVLAPQIEGLGYKLKITDKSQAPLRETAGATLQGTSVRTAPAGFTTHRIMERKRVQTKTGKTCWHLLLSGIKKDATLWDTEIGPWLELQPPGAEIVCELSPSKDPDKYGPSIKHIFRINDTEFDDDNKPVLQRG